MFVFVEIAFDQNSDHPIILGGAEKFDLFELAFFCFVEHGVGILAR